MMMTIIVIKIVVITVAVMITEGIKARVRIQNDFYTKNCFLRESHLGPFHFIKTIFLAFFQSQVTNNLIIINRRK